jgi:hypothetical protein
MGIVAGLGAAAAAASLGSTISNATSGGGATGTQGGNPAAYIPQAQPQADALYQNIFNSMAGPAGNLPGQVLPGYQAYAGNIQNNPFAGQALQGAQLGAALGPQAAGIEMGGAQNLFGGAQNVLNTGFDPQQALYGQLQNQTTQQANAANAMSGVTGPYAAGTIDQSLQNFNIGWQNQQLGRQESSLASAGTGFGQAGALGNAAIGTLAQSSQLPYSTYLGQQQTDIGALGSLVGGTNAAFGADESLANLLQSYLGLGQSATGLAQQGQAQQFGQNQILGQQFGQGLSALGNAFGSNSGSNFGGLFQPAMPAAPGSPSNQFSPVDPSAVNPLSVDS